MAPRFPQRFRSLLIGLGKSAAGVILVLLVAEACLRLFGGYPRGSFDFLLTGLTGFYPENQVLELTWGPVPYTKTINSLGLQGPDFPFKKRKGTVRILAIGDSVTEGYFVDTEDTYPFLLDGMLRERGLNAEVINLAKGGGSIGLQHGLMRAVGFELQPDIVLLTFVTNDIAEIMDKDRDRLVSVVVVRERRKRTWVTWALTKTATGEALLDAYLRLTTSTYRAHERNLTVGADRYDFEGSRDIERNIALFQEKFGHHDGLVLADPLAPETERAIDNYLFALRDLERLCREHGARLAVIYFPAYPQVYDDKASLHMRDILADACGDEEIPFLDLVPAFRAAGRERVLYLAPVDFHPNPEGYRVMAAAVADFLEREEFRAVWSQVGQAPDAEDPGS